jgi:transmembrane sensor
MKGTPEARGRSRGGLARSPGMDDAASDWLARRDDGLTAAEEAEFRSWIAADPRHATALQRMQAAWGALDQRLEAGAADAVLRQLESSARQRRRRRVAATVAGLAVLVSASLVWEARKTNRHAFARPDAVVLLPARRVLPDGSVVELKEGARIAVDFSGAYRRVGLEAGEAHFQVAGIPQRPFIVTAAGVDVRAVGTAFSVQLRPAAVEVLVTEGQVRVEEPALRPANGAPSAAGAASRSALVNAGSRLIVNIAAPSVPLSGARSIPADEMAARLAWRSPRVEFSDAPLSEAVDFLNRYNRVKFVIEDASLAHERVSGLFRADKTDAFIQILEDSFGVRADRRGDSEIVLRRAR